VKQSHIASAVEAVVSTLIGMVLAWLAQIVLFRVYGVQASHGQILSITLWLSGVSILRQFVMRRLWNAQFWHRFGWFPVKQFASDRSLIDSETQEKIREHLRKRAQDRGLHVKVK
jgi:hypothetical protein